MTVPGNIDALLLGGQRGYQIERSLRFNSADSAYLNRTPAGSGTGAGRTWTWSGWVKRSKSTPSDLQVILSAATSGVSSDRSAFGFFTSSGGGTGSDTFSIYHGAAVATRIETTQVFRDFSAWYHIVVSVDTTQATAANRIRIYVNGAEVTQFASATYPAQNYQFGICQAVANNIGRDAGGAAYYFDGYLTECHLVDGQQLTPSSFGETDTITGVWKPKRYSGSGYGTNGFYLNFKDNSSVAASTLGKDYSGNGNNWTPSATFSVTAGAGNDSMIDTPTPYADGGNGRGNYATMNPLDGGASGSTLSDGNLKVVTSSSVYTYMGSTIWPSAGKFYAEFKITSSSGFSQVGIATKTASTNEILGVAISSWGYNGWNGTYLTNGSATAFGSTFGTGDTIGIAIDRDTHKLYFSKNGTWQNSANPAAGTGSISISGISGVAAMIAICDNNAGGSDTFEANFGQRAFAYTPPSGFLALNTQNLPEPSIKKPSSYMDVKLYTGTAGTLTVTGLGFSPDLVWIKGRNAATTHVIQDTVRGATAYLSSNSTAAENTNTANDWFRAFTSDGFTVAATTSGGTPTSEWNNSGSTYVAWCWDESATPGFDIVTYTGNGTARTIAHSLGVAPSMIITQARTNNIGYNTVYHTSVGAGAALFLNLTNASNAGANIWNNTAPTSSVFSLGSDGFANSSSATYVAWLWSEVAGFSKFGSYTGNGSSDGPFVHLGFRPRYLLVKRSDSANDWLVFDSARDQYNETDDLLYPNLANAEASNSATDFDFLSNGFKLRAANANQNASGGTYIFAAFAESPQKYSLAR